MTPDDFPADTRTLALPPADFTAEGVKTIRFHLLNNSMETALHLRLTSEAGWLTVTPQEAVLGPGEKQLAVVALDVPAARKRVLAGGPPSIPLAIMAQRLSSSGPQNLPPANVYVRMPVVICPTCERTLDVKADDELVVPEVCPFCYERLRQCPVCGTPNTWLARQCGADPDHAIRTQPDWVSLGGSAAHEGMRHETGTGLTRLWSYPSVPPTRMEQLYAWSAPVAAYGIVAAAAATPEGDAHLYAFQTRNGAPLWEPYPLADPVYPERGGAAIQGGRLLAATVEGLLVAVDIIRGTRLWEKRVGGRVYGAVVPASDDGPILVPVMAPSGGGGSLVQLDPETGRLLCQTPLSGPPDAAPASDGVRAFIHDDSGSLTAIALGTGAVLWSCQPATSFNASPVVSGGMVFSAAEDGTVRAYDTETGAEVWSATLTNAALSGTPACDGNLLCIPADDGLHLVSAAAGRAVRRYPTLRPIRSAPVLLDGTALFGSVDGNVFAAPSGRSLEMLYETGGIASQIVAAPAFADETFFAVATNGVLYALGLS